MVIFALLFLVVITIAIVIIEKTKFGYKMAKNGLKNLFNIDLDDYQD
jgi:ABC-type uncharacterized transport system permease subunit